MICGGVWCYVVLFVVVCWRGLLCVDVCYHVVVVSCRMTLCDDVCCCASGVDVCYHV